MKMSLKQRILRHVRIHGGDSNALARAMHCGVQKDTLMTNEKGLFAQAGLRNVRGSTIERKIMSTKTTTKRISLVAALALGFGVVTGVAANAATASTVVFTSGTTTLTGTGTGTASATGAVGTAVQFTATAAETTAANALAGGVTTVTPVFTGTAVTNAASAISAASGLTVTAGTLVNATASTVTAGVISYTTTTAATATSGTSSYTFTPDVPGTYILTLTPSGTGAAGATAGVLTYTATASGPIFLTTGNTPAPVAASVTSGSNLVAVAGGFAKFTLAQGSTNTLYNITATGMTISGVSTQLNRTVDATQLYTNLNGVNVGGGVQWAPASIAGYITVTVTSPTAGTGTLTVAPIGATGIPGTAVTGTVTWGSALGVSTQYSLLTSNAGAGTTATGSSADTKLTTVATTAGTKQFTIQAVLKDQNNLAINDQVLGASIAGPGTIGIATTTASTAASAGRSLTVTLTSTNLGHVTVFGDGTAGVATVTVTSTNAAGVTTIIGTKQYTFAGSPAKATVAQGLYIAKAGTQLGSTPTTTVSAGTSVATTAAFTAKVVDSAGVPVVAGSTVKMTSSNTAVITTGSCAELTVNGVAVGTAAATPGVFECSVSGAAGAISGSSATVTFSVLNSTTGLYDIVAAPLTFKIGGSIATVTVALDKATYTPGAAMNLTATAIDSTGFAAYDGQKPYITAALTANMSVGGALPVYTTAETVNGKSSTTGTSASLFAPASTGDLTISGTAANTAAAGIAFTIPAKISVSSTTDAQIASLITKINALAALIAKIQKKLGIK
jgi:adhesin HecA-like repeat protein